MELRNFGGETAFRDAARDEGFGEPYGWSNAPHDAYARHEHGYEKLLICSAGSITFELGADGRSIVLEAGDGLLLHAGTPHAAVVGAQGCTCLEAHRPARG